MVSHQAAGVALDGAGATAQRDWRARAVGGLLLTAQWLFLLTIAFLPIDVYLTLPTQQTGVFLSQVLAIEAVGMLVVGLLAGKVLGRATGLQLAWKDLLPLGFVLAAAALS